MIKNRWFKFKDIMLASYGKYILQGTSNLDTGTASRREVKYINTDGVKYKDIQYSARFFEISGVIMAQNCEEMVKLKRELIRACSLKEPFRLKYFNRDRVYSAECYFDKLPTFSQRQQWTLAFKLYLVIPGFYWQSETAYTFNIFGYRDLISDTFTLPCVFTELTNHADINNRGDVETLPIFTVTCETSAEDSSVVIINAESGKAITLNYTTSANEVITIDTFAQTAVSNINGNITDKFDISTEFFNLKPGINHLMCESEGNIVTVRFFENYLGV